MVERISATGRRAGRDLEGDSHLSWAVFTRGSVGIFLTRWQRVPQDDSAWVAERQAITDEVLGPGARLHRWKGFDTHNADNWSAMCDWLHEKLVVLLQILEAQPDGTPPLTPPPQSPATPPARTAEVP